MPTELKPGLQPEPQRGLQTDPGFELKLRAWNALALGPLWVRRRDTAVKSEYGVDETTELPLPAAEPQTTPGELAVAAAAPPDSWEAVRAEVASCRLCGLCESRKQTVFGTGSQTARWMLIGEAPGEQEDARGEPFVGNAGRLLEQMLAAIGLAREADVFITNVLKCRPPDNRNPQVLEVQTCSRYLYRQIDLLQPDLIVLLGRFAMQSVLQTDASVASLRQKVHRFQLGARAIPVVCTYHPAYLLRNLSDKRKSWEDLCLAVDVAGQVRDQRQSAPAKLADLSG